MGRPIGRLVAGKPKARHGPKGQKNFRNRKIEELDHGNFCNREQKFPRIFRFGSRPAGRNAAKATEVFHKPKMGFSVSAKSQISTGKCGFPQKPPKGPTDD